MQSGEWDTTDVIAVVEALLARTGRRPTAREIANEFGMTALTLRRRWRAVTGHPPLRHIITVACLRRAAIAPPGKNGRERRAQWHGSEKAPASGKRLLDRAHREEHFPRLVHERNEFVP
jgi:hypothetical protein